MGVSVNRAGNITRGFSVGETHTKEGRMKRVAILVAIAFVALLGAGGAEAVTWDFACTPSGCTNNTGLSTKTYTVGANSLIVSGFDNAPTTPGLLTEKNDGSLTGEESGVGLTS